MLTDKLNPEQSLTGQGKEDKCLKGQADRDKPYHELSKMNPRNSQRKAFKRLEYQQYSTLAATLQTGKYYRSEGRQEI